MRVTQPLAISTTSIAPSGSMTGPSGKARPEAISVKGDVMGCPWLTPSVGRRLLDDLVEGSDGVADLVGPIRWLRVGLEGDHQILVGNPDVEGPITKTLALVEPLRAERPENPIGQPEGEAARVIGGDSRDGLACFGRDKLGPLFLLLRWNHLAAENRPHPAIDVAGAGDGSASRLHPDRKSVV